MERRLESRPGGRAKGRTLSQYVVIALCLAFALVLTPFMNRVPAESLRSSCVPTAQLRDQRMTFKHQNPSIALGKLPSTPVKVLPTKVPISLASRWHGKDLGHLGLYRFLGDWNLMTRQMHRPPLSLRGAGGGVFPIR